MADGTNIRVSDETWRELNQLKQPGESFEDVIVRILEERDDE
jgi:predicted CopG family antitoxin